MRAKLLLGLAAASLGLILIEGFLRRYPPAPIYMVTRAIIQRGASEPIVHPILGYVPRANLTIPFGNLEFSTTVTINSKNMRDAEYALAKPPGTRRIVAVGDSFVCGWGVEDPERATELLEHRHLKSVEVLNLGVSGYSRRGGTGLAEGLGLAYRPDIVLFFTLACRRAPEVRLRGRHFYWADALERSPLRRLKGRLTRGVYAAALADWAVHAAFARGGPEPAIESWDEAILKDLGDLAQTNGFKPVIVFCPDKDERLAPRPDELEAACRRYGLGFLDLTPVLPDSSYFKHDDHWNRQGHAAAAQALAGYLFDHHLLNAGRKRAS